MEQQQHSCRSSISRKRRNRPHDLKTRLAAIDYAKENSNTMAARKYDVDSKSIREWRKAEDDIRRHVDGGKSKRLRLEGGGRKSKKNKLSTIQDFQSMMSQVPALATSGMDRLLTHSSPSNAAIEIGSPDRHTEEPDDISPLVAIFKQFREEKETRDRLNEQEIVEMRPDDTPTNEHDTSADLEDRMYAYIDTKFQALQTHLDARLSTIECLLKDLTCNRTEKE